jgi:hypothetical protein
MVAKTVYFHSVTTKIMFVLFTGDERIRQDKGQAGQDRSHCGRSLVRCIQVNLFSYQTQDKIGWIETTFKLSNDSKGYVQIG